jgi:hypothetical protein
MSTEPEEELEEEEWSDVHADFSLTCGCKFVTLRIDDGRCESAIRVTHSGLVDLIERLTRALREMSPKN